jgi:hypothetical protein
MPVFFTAEEVCRTCGIALGYDTIPAAPPAPAKKSARAEQPPDQSTPVDQED